MSLDILPSSGLHVVQGELIILLNAMRRPIKWSTQYNQEEEQDALLRNLNHLRDKLNAVSSLNELDLLDVLGPFLEVIRSEDTSGPITELALSAVFKFLSYGLIDPELESAPSVVESLAAAVTHARFVGTDSGSDEVVLMKILQVLRMLVLCPSGILLSNESICEIMQSCFRFCFETRLSELLRKSAEHSLSEMVRLLYTRLPHFSLQETKGLINYKKLKMRTSSYDPSRNKKKSRSPKPRPKTLPLETNGNSKPTESSVSPTSPKEAPAEEPKPETPTELIASPVEEGAVDPAENAGELPLQSMEELKITESSGETLSISETVADEPASGEGDEAKDYVNAQGVRFVAVDPATEEHGRVHVPYGLPCVRELLRFLISLINPLERQNSEAMIHIGLRVLTVAVETSADFIATVPSLLALIQDETCRHLFSLLNSERLSVLAASCRLCFLLFESARSRLKFQLEMYLTKLVEIIVHESPKVGFERRLVALEAVAQLFRIPGLVTELYLNYDCDCHTSDLFEDLVKHLAKNVNPVTGIYATHLLSLEILLIAVDSIAAHCLIRLNQQNAERSLPPAARKSRFEIMSDIPSQSYLAANKRRKQLLIAGADLFNARPAKGIQFLQEHGLLSTPLDPQQVANFLRENPRLDKKMIGEYVSNRQNLVVLEAFARSFGFQSTRIDEALRLYLEAFRLPGEAPLISVIMEQFADHWSKCNDQPFASADAAFTLSYAVIMLNVDQHNANAKKQSTPMTSDAFKRNLSGVNGGKDFEPEMLEEIYQAICSDEIVMPAEQTGLVKENYLWRVLLRRGATKDGVFYHTPNALFDAELFRILWGPLLTALGLIYDKCYDEDRARHVLIILKKMSLIAAHFQMSDVFDNIVSSLVKFSTLLQISESPVHQAIVFGQNKKAHLATGALFYLIHKHGEILRQGWQPIVDCIVQFYRMKILPDSLIETDDLFDPNVKIKLIPEEAPSVRSESFISSFYSYIVLSDAPIVKAVTPEDREAIRQSKTCVNECKIDQLVTDTKFLHIDALQEFVRVLIGSARLDTSSTDEYTVVFLLEMIIRITVQNRDRVTCIWNQVRDHIYSLVMGAAAAERNFILERAIVGLLLLTGKLMRREDVAPIVLQSLRMLLLLKPQTLSRVSRQIAYGLHELLKTGAANVHTTGDWRVFFTLLECVGAGAKPPSVRGTKEAEHQQSESEDRGYTSDSELYESRVNRSAPAHGSNPELNVVPAGGGGWIFVGREGEIEHLKGKKVPGQEYNIVHNRELNAHDPQAFVKACESLAFLVRDVAHITPENFESAVQCIRTFVEASLIAGRHSSRRESESQRQRGESFRRSKSISSNGPSYDMEDGDVEDLPSNYHQVPVQLLDLMHTLHTRAAQIYEWWASEGGDAAGDNLENLCPSLWSRAWCPLLQGIARLCCDSRKQVRTTAITYLQRSLLVHDLQSLTASEWESCFNTVLFPLLSKLLDTKQQLPSEHAHWEETRMRAATLLSKVFLQHLGPLLQSSTFTALWMTLLEFMDKYMHAEQNDLLAEAIPEMMKNLLLVMETAGAFGPIESEQTHLWVITWDRIDLFLPGLRQEVSRSRTPLARVQTEAAAGPINEPVVPQEEESSSMDLDSADISSDVKDSLADANSNASLDNATATNAEIREEADQLEIVQDIVQKIPEELFPVDAESNDASFFNNLPSIIPSAVNEPESTDHDTGLAMKEETLRENVSTVDNPLTYSANHIPILPIPLPVQESGAQQNSEVKNSVNLAVDPIDIQPTGHLPLLRFDEAIINNVPLLPILARVNDEAESS